MNEDWQNVWDQVNNPQTGEAADTVLVAGPETTNYTAKAWGMKPAAVKRILFNEVLDKRLPANMQRKLFYEWVEREYKRWYHKWNRNEGARMNVDL